MNIGSSKDEKFCGISELPCPLIHEGNTKNVSIRRKKG